MDSKVQLALMSKAKKVFGAEDTFLSFPVSPLPFTKRQLDLFSQQDAEALRQSMNNLESFSKLVNLIPEDEAWLPTESTFLWDVYDQILKEGKFAFSSRTPEENFEYKMALAYLRTADDAGGWTDSAAMKAYRQHKDTYLLAQQTYQAAKSTAELSTDPAEQQRWREVEEPEQRTELDNLQAQWIIQGHKNEVEDAQSTVVNLGARSPLQTWSEWKGRFNRDIDALTGAGDAFTFFPSIYSPLNALEEGAWKPFQLSEAEVNALLAEAPPEMRARYSEASAAAGVESLAFEFSSATILRPWFASEAFKSRFWRFADEGRVISDGSMPATGACPAYVTAVVFARKVTVKQKQEDPGGQSSNFKGFRFEMAVSDQAQLPRIREQTAAAEKLRYLRVTESVIERPPLAGLQIEHTEEINPRGTEIARQRAVMMDAASVSNLRAIPMFNQEVSARAINNVQAISFSRNRVSEEALMGAPFVAAAVTPTPSPTPPPAPPSEPALPADIIFIFAFICKALPKCPNPDPALQW